MKARNELQEILHVNRAFFMSTTITFAVDVSASSFCLILELICTLSSPVSV